MSEDLRDYQVGYTRGFSDGCQQSFKLLAEREALEVRRLEIPVNIHDMDFYKELKAKASELDKRDAGCATCRATYAFEYSKTNNRGAQLSNSELANYCPACGKDLVR